MEINVDERQGLLYQSGKHTCLSCGALIRRLPARKEGGLFGTRLNPAAAVQFFVQFNHLALQRSDLGLLF